MNKKLLLLLFLQLNQARAVVVDEHHDGGVSFENQKNSTTFEKSRARELIVDGVPVHSTSILPGSTGVLS